MWNLPSRVREMTKIGIKNESVAIWLGYFNNQEKFEEFTKVHYELLETSKDMSAMNSLFDNAFNLEEYDREIVERGFHTYCKSYYELLQYASYLSEYVKDLSTEETKYNCLILIYDYHYDGDVATYQDGENRMDFFKNLDYVKDDDISRWLKMVHG